MNVINAIDSNGPSSQIHYPNLKSYPLSQTECYQLYTRDCINIT